MYEKTKAIVLSTSDSFDVEYKFKEFGVLYKRVDRDSISFSLIEITTSTRNCTSNTILVDNEYLYDVTVGGDATIQDLVDELVIAIKNREEHLNNYS